MLTNIFSCSIFLEIETNKLFGENKLEIIRNQYKMRLINVKKVTLKIITSSIPLH